MACCILLTSCSDKSTEFTEFKVPEPKTTQNHPDTNNNNRPQVSSQDNDGNDDIRTSPLPTVTPQATPIIIPPPVVSPTPIITPIATPIATPVATPLVTPANTPTIIPTPIVKLQNIDDQFIQNNKPLVDILWVIDNSGSMGNEQASLAMHFDRFINNFIVKDVPFRMAITTTDAKTSWNGRDGRDGTSVCDWHKLTAYSAQADIKSFKSTFKKCINVGVKGSGIEQGLNGAARFLTRYGRQSGYSPFLRKDAYLIIIIVSDEEDQNTRPVQKYLNSFYHYKNYQKGKVKVYSIVNLLKSDIRTSYESLGLRYKLASLKTQGNYASIRSNFSSTLANFSDGILNLISSFTLSQTPYKISDSRNLIVKVNGRRTTNFTYYKAKNYIRFWKGSVPPAGSSINISYKIQVN